jgi:hypothetical protein
MSVPLDPVGNISFVLQIVILFLLILGLPFVKGIGTKKNFMSHGYLTVLALVLHTVLIVIVMLPTFSSGFSDIGELSLFESFTVWSHAVLGTAAEVAGIVIVGFWFSKPLKNMACFKAKKLMMPVLIIWIISIINGALIHILGML